MICTCHLSAACAAWVVPKTTDRDSLRYTYNGTRRVRQLALGCESNSHDAYENTWKCGELKLYFSPSAGGWKKKKKKKCHLWTVFRREYCDVWIIPVLLNSSIGLARSTYLVVRITQADFRFHVFYISWRRHELLQVRCMLRVPLMICLLIPGSVFPCLPVGGILFLSSRVTGACPVTTEDLIMRVNVRTKHKQNKQNTTSVLLPLHELSDTIIT